MHLDTVRHSRTSFRPFRACLAFMVATPLLVGAQPDTLRKLADLRGIYVGAAVSSKSEIRTPAYDTALARNFNGMVAENAMKFRNLSSARGVYNFATADAMADFARNNGMKLRGHTLVWHTSTAVWFNDLSGQKASRDTTLKILREHIDTVVGRYKGRIHEWDVVNEAISATNGPSPNYRTDSRWHQRVGGIDYVDSAFKWAQRADTNALLFYNDFDGEGMNQKSQNIYDLVTDLKKRGVPIHGVGLQCHLWLGGVDTAAMGRNMRRLAALGFVLSLTEVDVEASSSTADLASQKAHYKALAKLCLSIPACKSFYTWGLNDEQSYRGVNASALMFRGTPDLTPKPAYWGVVEALQEGSTATSAPSAPWNVVASPAGDGLMAVQWMPPIADGRRPITGYKAMAVADTNKSCTTTGALACVVRGLSSDTTYRFTVRAYNSVGASGQSPPSLRASGPIAVPASYPPDTVPLPPDTVPLPQDSLPQDSVPLAPTGADRGAAGGFATPFTYRLSASALRSVDRMTMIVTDASGRVVWSESVRPAASSLREISWKGLTHTGGRAQAGVYVLRVRVEQAGGRRWESIGKGVFLSRH